MLSKQEIDNVISIWKDRFGIERTSKNGTIYKIIPNSTKERQKAITYLVLAFKEQLGYKAEDFTPVLRKIIVDNCTYTRWEDRVGLYQWQNAVQTDLSLAMDHVFGSSVKFMDKKDERLSMSEIKLNEVEVQKLNLQPGEVLVVKVKSDDFDEAGMQYLGQGLRKIFPNNKVLVLGVEKEGSIDLTIAKGSEYPETNFCSDCACGKKAAYEGK